MSVDSNSIQPKALELIRKPHDSKVKAKQPKQNQETVEDVNEGQLRNDKELGFQTVQPRTRRQCARK